MFPVGLLLVKRLRGHWVKFHVMLIWPKAVEAICPKAWGDISIWLAFEQFPHWSTIMTVTDLPFAVS